MKNRWKHRIVLVTVFVLTFCLSINLSKNPLKSKLITGFKITSREKKDLLKFLHSLTDESFITNPAFSDPNQN